MTQPGSNQVDPSFLQRPSAVQATHRSLAPQPAARRRPGSTGSSVLESLAGNLRALAQEIDGLSRSENLDAAEFIQLDTAARHALAAAYAIDTAESLKVGGG